MDFAYEWRFTPNMAIKTEENKMVLCFLTQMEKVGPNPFSLHSKFKRKLMKVIMITTQSGRGKLKLNYNLDPFSLIKSNLTKQQHWSKRCHMLPLME